MALTPQDLADVCNKAGIETPEAFAQLIQTAGASVAVIAVQAEIARVEAERNALNAKTETQLAALRAEVARLEAVRDGVA